MERERPILTKTGQSGAGAPKLALAALAEVEFRMGDWQAAYASAVEALRVAYSSGERDQTVQALAHLALVEAGLGREQACHVHGEQALAMATSDANDVTTARAREALGLLELGLGHMDATVAWLEPLVRSATRPPDTCDADLAEALIRRGERARAARTVARAAGRAPTAWSQQALERCRGLLAADDEFEACFTHALDHPTPLADPFGRARTELCFGQRLRRVGRRVVARERLRSALETFEHLGAAPWAETALCELSATGDRTARPLDSRGQGLTARELEVALRVSEGATNREAAGALFLTVKTVEAHLRSIYRKLGIRSRAELTRVVLSGEGSLQAQRRTSASSQS